MKTFPILFDRKKYPACPAEVPWDFVEPARKQAYENHGQTLERLAERGGLDPGELWCALNNKSLNFGKTFEELKTFEEESVNWLQEKLIEFNNSK